MPLVHFDRQTVIDFFAIPLDEAEQTVKQIGYKDPIDVHDEFSGDDVKAIAMTYAHRKYPAAVDTDKVSFGSQVSYCVCGMYTGVAHYIKEQRAERVFEEFKKAFGVDPGDEGPEIQGDITAAEFTLASIFLLEALILFRDQDANVSSAIRLMEQNGRFLQPGRLDSIKKILSGIQDIKL